MSIVSMIAAERNRYVTFFEAAVEDARSKFPALARELLISINDEALPYPYRYIRADIVAQADDGENQIFELWLDPSAEAEGRGFQLGPVAIEVHPFTWCAVQIAFDKPLPDLVIFEAMLTDWLEINDQRTSDSGIANAIHSVTRVETNGQLWFLTIDFGTSTEDILLDLIDFLANEALVDRIVLGSPQRS